VRIRTDDEVYRVDAVWLGPPKATFPWRARYVAWGVGIAIFLLTLTVERRIGFGFNFFNTAWAIVITIALTRLICSRINNERPLGSVAVMWLRELTAPREKTSGRGGAVTAAHLRVAHERPRPKNAPPPRTPRRRRSSGQARTPVRTKEVGGVRTPAKP
jgi:hypothetical protein